MPYKGGRRKKSKTQKPLGPDAGVEKVPRSMVIHRGKVDSSVSDLLQDIRKMMMPHTAARLRERKTNTLRDFVDVSSLLGVSHLLMLSQSATNVALRIARAPRGPTLTYRVSSFTLARHIRAAQKRPSMVPTAFDSPPLVVMHNFSAVAAAGGKAPGSSGVSLADAMKMTMATFQAMFPNIDPATLKLVDCRRVVLIHFNKTTQEVELRHYMIRAVPVGVSRGVKKLTGASALRQLPNLSKLDDISEFLLSGGGGGASDSEYEGPEGEARVTLPQNYAGKGNSAQQASAIKLSEIGPRLSLSLVKIEQGLCAGEVLYHAFVEKSAEEAARLRDAAVGKERERKRRRAEQEANVARKTEAAVEKKEAKAARIAAKQQSAVTAAASGTLGDDDDDAVDEGAAADDEADDDDDAEEEGGDAAPRPTRSAAAAVAANSASARPLTRAAPAAAAGAGVRGRASAEMRQTDDDDDDGTSDDDTDGDDDDGDDNNHDEAVHGEGEGSDGDDDDEDDDDDDDADDIVDHDSRDTAASAFVAAPAAIVERANTAGTKRRR